MKRLVNKTINEMTNEYYGQSEKLNGVLLKNEFLQEEVNRLAGIISIQNSDIKTYLKKTRMYQERLNRLFDLAEENSGLGDIRPRGEIRQQHGAKFNSI